METKQYKSVFLPKKLVVKTTDKAILWKLPEMKGETDKYFWVSRKFVHPVGKDFVVNYEENFQFTVFEQIKNEQGNFERVNPQEVTGEELKGIFIKYDPKIEEAYWRWKVKNEVTPGSANTSQYKEEKKEPSVLKHEFRKAIADQFLKLLDSSNSKKRFGWVKEWRMNGGQQNLNSGKNYRGINRLVLALKAYEKGYSDPRWITFNGLKDYKRAYIKKGEHGTQVEYWAAVKRNPIYDEMTKKMKRFFTISEMNQYLKNHPEEKNNDFYLKRGVDNSKDQTYFLSRIGQKALSKTIFPIGDIEKSKVREIAKEHNLATALKKDSTGVCFIGERNFDKFLDKYLLSKKGDIIDIDSNKKIGTHNGIIHYTLGQRKGLGIGGVGNGKPWFVAGKNLKENIVYVAQGEEHEALFTKSMIGENPFWILEKEPVFPLKCTAKFRYRQSDIPVSVYKLDNGNLKVEYDFKVKAVTPGQVAVFYDKEYCLGSCIIKDLEPLNDKYRYLNI